MGTGTCIHKLSFRPITSKTQNVFFFNIGPYNNPEKLKTFSYLLCKGKGVKSYAVWIKISSGR